MRLILRITQCDVERNRDEVAEQDQKGDAGVEQVGRFVFDVPGVSCRRFIRLSAKATAHSSIDRQCHTRTQFRLEPVKQGTAQADFEDEDDQEEQQVIVHGPATVSDTEKKDQNQRKTRTKFPVLHGRFTGALV